MHQKSNGGGAALCVLSKSKRGSACSPDCSVVDRCRRLGIESTLSSTVSFFSNCPPRGHPCHFAVSRASSVLCSLRFQPRPAQGSRRSRLTLHLAHRPPTLGPVRW